MGRDVGQGGDGGRAAVGFDDAGGQDAHFAVKAVDGQGVDGVAEPVEVAGDGGRGADGEGEGEAVLVVLLARRHMEFHG